MEPPIRIGHRDPGPPPDSCGCCEGSRPLTPAPITNRPNLPAIAFRSGGHARHKLSMLAGLSSRAAPALEGLGSRDDGDVSIALIDAWASALEVLGFYQERLANEAYIGTATERFSIGELARLVGYRLHPGAAAQTDLVLLMDDPPGAEPAVADLTVPAGTRVQSQPGPGETAQVFETIAPLDARVAWNRLRPRQSELVLPGPGDRTAWIAGTPPLAPGDLLLFLGPERAGGAIATDWNVRRVISAVPEADGARTRLEWDAALGDQIAAEGLRLMVMRERASLFGHNAPDPKVFSDDQLENFGFFEGSDGGAIEQNFEIEDPAGSGSDDEPIDADTPPSEWRFALPFIPATSLPGDFNGHIPLDGIYKGFVANSWIVMSARRGLFAPYRVRSSWDDGLTAYAISGKSTGIEPDRPNGGREFRSFYRGTSVWGASEELAFAERAIPDFVSGSDILLATRPADLPEGRRLVLRGPRARVRLTSGPVTLTAEDGTTREIDEGLELIVITTKEVPFLFTAFFFNIVVNLGDIFTAAGGGGGSPGNPITGPAILANPEDGGGGGPGPFVGPGAFDSVAGSGPDIVLPTLVSWTLQDVDGFTGTVATLPGAFVPVPAHDDDPVVAETATLDRVEPADTTRSRLILESALANVYDRTRLAIHGNVAQAAHGEDVTEILGAGDPSMPFQKFVLGQAPVTHRLASTPNGVESTLTVRVDGVAWEEVADLHDRGSEAQVFRTVLTDDGQTIVEFGDGRSGARPAPGRDNIVARFSRGLGRAGNLRAGQLSMPLDRPLGLREAFNPLPATGGSDAEVAEDARRNAPLHTLTLGRVVSITDYRDFALGFPGIAKAESRWVLNGVTRRVVVTVAGDDGAPLPPDGPTHAALLGAFRDYGDPLVDVDLIAFVPTVFRLALKVAVEPAHETATVLAAVEARLRADFAFAARDFAQEVALSAIAASAHRVEGVRAVDVDRLYRDTPPQTKKKAHDRLVALPGRRGPDGALLPAEILTLAPGPFDWLELMP